MRIISLICCILFLVSCESSTQRGGHDLLGSWRLQDIVSRSGSDDFEQAAALKEDVNDGMILSLFADGTYSHISGTGEYLHGRWDNPDENTLRFIRSDGRVDHVKMVLKNRTKKHHRLVLKNDSKNIDIKYVKEGAPLKTTTNDPFHFSNNSWRIKAAKRETPQELRARLANYFRHFACVLKAAKDREQDAVHFGFSQGPVKVYNNGIGIHRYDIVPETWKNCFYDEADAAAAYREYEKLLSNTSYKGASMGNWIEDDYNILQNLYMELTKKTPAYQ